MHLRSDLARECDDAFNDILFVGVDSGVHALDLSLGVGVDLGRDIPARPDESLEWEEWV